MATRLYFHNQTDSTSGLPTAEQSSLTSNKNAEGSQTTNRIMNITIGTSQASLQMTSNAVSSTQNYYFTRFVSPALDMASISANTWTYNIATRQNSTQNRGNFPVDGNDQPVRVNCYVWRPGTGKIGTILDGNTAATVDENGNSEVVHHVTFSGSSVSSMAAGDRLVFEVWFVIQQVSGITSTNTIYYDGATVNTTDNATVSNHASFIETPQTLTFDEGGSVPVGNESSHIYTIDGIEDPTVFVGNSSMHRYRILPQQQGQPDQITAEGFSIFMRVYIPFLNNEALYNKRGVLFSKIDDEQVTHAYIAQISDNGDIHFVVKDNSREYVLSKPNAITVLNAGDPDFADSDFNSQDFFTISSLLGSLPNPILYDDLAFTYSFVDHRMQIYDNGTLIADSSDNPESTGLVGWWRLNEGGDIGNEPVEPTTFDRIVYNSIVTGSNGTISNAAWQTISGIPHETYLNFDGNNDLVNISNYSNIQNLSAFTVSLWYYPKSAPSTEGFLVQKNTGTTNRWLIYHDTTGFVRFSIWNNSSTRFDITFNSAFPILNQWYHIAAKVTLGSTGKIFVDNVKVTGGGNVTGTLDTGTSNLQFGGTSTSNTPTALIHDVKLWNRELSDSEIESIFNNGHVVSGFPTWKEDPPPPPDVPVPITNPFTQVYHLAKPSTNLDWQTLHKLVASGFTQVYQNQDGVLVEEVTEQFANAGYTVTGSGGGGGGGGSTETVYNQPITSGNHLEFEGGISRAGVRFNSGNAHLGKVVKSVSVRFRKQGSPGGTASVGIRRASGDAFVSLGTFSPGSFGSGEQVAVINASSNTYAMAANDIVSVEYPSGSNTIELTYSSSGVSGFTSLEYDGSWGTFDDGGLTTIAMQIDVSAGGGGGGAGLAMYGGGTGINDSVTVAKIHVNSTSAAIYNKKITRVKLQLSKVGSPTGTLQVQLRSSDTSAQVNMGSLNVATQITGTVTEYLFTNTNNGLDSGFALPNGGGVAIAYSGGNESNYVVVQASTASEVANVHLRKFEWNPGNQAFPFGQSYSWVNVTASDITGTLETGGFIIPAKQPWFALDGGAVRAVGQRVINASSNLAGKKVTRIKPKLKAIGNPTGTIRAVIRTSAGTEVGNLGSIEANTVSPSNFAEYEFTNILQPRTLVAGDQIMIEYVGTTAAHIQIMVEWDESHGGQLGNEQAVTFNGSAYTAITADLCGTIFVGGSATDPTARERMGVKVDTPSSILYLKKPSKVLAWIRKVGTPPGNVFCRIRRQSDDNTVANVGQITTTSITAEGQYEFINSPVSIYAMQENDSLLIEYPDGDDTNYIQVAYTTTDQINGTHSILTKFDALFTDYDNVATNDFIATIHSGGDTFTPTGDEIPPAPPPQYSHDLHIFAGGYPYDYYDDISTVENWISVICPDLRFYRKILTAEELVNLFENRRDRSSTPYGQVAVVGFFSMPP